MLLGESKTSLDFSIDWAVKLFGLAHVSPTVDTQSLIIVLQLLDLQIVVPSGVVQLMSCHRRQQLGNGQLLNML